MSSHDINGLLEDDPDAHIVVFTRFQSINKVKCFMENPVNGLTHMEFMTIFKGDVNSRYDTNQ